MARITMEITDCEDGQIEARLLVDAALPEDRTRCTPAQQLALLVRDALLDKDRQAQLLSCASEHQEEAMTDPTPKTIPRPRRLITLTDYADGVATLAEAAMHATSGGRAAAQVLLSAYNGYEFHLDATDLCLLDDTNLAAAMAVLQGRVVCGREPHQCIEDGDAVFREIWQRWEHLSVSQRYAEHYGKD